MSVGCVLKAARNGAYRKSKNYILSADFSAMTESLTLEFSGCQNQPAGMIY